MTHGDAVWIHPGLVSEAVAARELGIRPTTLRRQIERIGLRPDARSATRRRYWDVHALGRALADAPDPVDATRALLASVLGRVDRTGDRSLTRQIADDLGAAVGRGALAGNGPLPSTGAIARHYDVSENTVRRAVRALCSEGVLVRRPGTRVTVPATPTGPGPAR